MTEATKRGWVYKWRKGKPDERNVIVISPDFRGNERMISVLMFGDAPLGRDVVEIKNKILGNKRFLHVGMLTYVMKSDLSETPLFHVSEKQMSQINQQLCIQLGLSTEKQEAELSFYKEICDQMIHELISVFKKHSIPANSDAG